ncbi:hypothetical protein ZWY2020_042831 [Hordeum vulgare]|nr:hypothetical protein ZWY2020_042831 [Hordeum vulgare]
MAYHATARSVFDSLIMNWNATYDYYNKVNAKQAYYLSMEFLQVKEQKLVNLVNLDLERCPKIHGGLVHLKGLRKLETLNMRYCNGITDSDMKYLSEITQQKKPGR